MESSFGGDECHYLHDRAAVLVDTEGRRDRAKGRGGGGFHVNRKNGEAMARYVRGRLASRTHMSNNVLMALVGRYFQKKMEKPGILECCGAVIRMEVVRAVCCGRVLKSGYALEIRDNHVGRGGEHGVVEHDLVGAASVPCSSEGTCRGKRAEHVRDSGSG